MGAAVCLRPRRWHLTVCGFPVVSVWPRAPWGSASPRRWAHWPSSADLLSQHVGTLFLLPREPRRVTGPQPPAGAQLKLRRDDQTRSRVECTAAPVQCQRSLLSIGRERGPGCLVRRPSWWWRPLLRVPHGMCSYTLTLLWEELKTQSNPSK